MVCMEVTLEVCVLITLHACADRRIYCNGIMGGTHSMKHVAQSHVRHIISF